MRQSGLPATPSKKKCTFRICKGIYCVNENIFFRIIKQAPMAEFVEDLCAFRLFAEVLHTILKKKMCEKRKNIMRFLAICNERRSMICNFGVTLRGTY